jgi:hypothetical protein
MKSFIESINSINSQVWAFLILLTGGAMVVVFHKSGLDIGIAAGVIGAAVQLFQSTTKAQLPDSKPVMTTPETPLPLQPVGPAQPKGI